MISRWIFGLLIFFLGLTQVHGQTSSVLDDLYGQGVHAYFARDYMAAEELLNRAVELGSQDPRAFYFRGLARSSYGADPTIDFQEGARLEATSRVGVNVGQALIRIQGPHRVRIEKARQDARLFAQQQRQQSRQAVPMPPAISQPSGRPPTLQPNPWDDAAPSAGVDIVPTPVPAPEAPSDFENNPFSDDSADPFPSGDEADPFEDEPGVGSFSEEPESPAEVDEFDPFGSDDPVADPQEDPFSS
jgi:hypothetical protein